MITVPYLPGATGWAAGTGQSGQWLVVVGSAYDTRLLFAERADAEARAAVLSERGVGATLGVGVRYVQVVEHPGVTLTGIAFRIIPEPEPDHGAAYRAALAADAPTGDPCPACHQLHDSASAETDCIEADS